MTKSPPNRRRFQFSMRSLLVAMAALGLAFGYLAWQERVVHLRQATRAQLEATGVQFIEFGGIGGNIEQVRRADRSAVPSFARKLLGDR